VKRKKPQTITLTGGGRGAIMALRRHFKAALQGVTSPKPLVAYVGVATGDSAGFFTMIKAGLALGEGVRMRMPKIASPRASASAARQLLDDCDLVFVSGGDVEMGMNTLHERDMVKHLRSLAEAGKPMFGISAGSLMLAQDWVRFPDDDEAKAELFPCLGIAPVHVDAHSEEDDWSELRVLVRLLHERGDKGALGYGLTKKGGLRLDVEAQNGATVTAIGTAIPRVGVKRDKVVDQEPLPLE
jgi:peptidase E